MSTVCILHIVVGIRQRLDYLTYLGIDAVLLSAFYDSPFEHLGRGVRDFTAIGANYGNIEDFELLVTELHHRGNTAPPRRHSLCALCVAAYNYC